MPGAARPQADGPPRSGSVRRIRSPRPLTTGLLGSLLLAGYLAHAGTRPPADLTEGGKIGIIDPGAASSSGAGSAPPAFCCDAGTGTCGTAAGVCPGGQQSFADLTTCAQSCALPPPVIFSSASGGGGSSPTPASSACTAGPDIRDSVLAGDKDGFGIGLQPDTAYATYAAFAPDTAGPPGIDQDVMDRPLLGNAFTPPAAQHPWYTPEMTKVPRRFDGPFPGYTFSFPPFTHLQTAVPLHLHRAWIRLHVADVDDAAPQCDEDVLDLRLAINGVEVPYAFDELLQKPAGSDTFYDGVSRIVTVPFDPVLLYGNHPQDPFYPVVNGAYVTVDHASPATADAGRSEVFAIDYAEILIDRVTCPAAWPACELVQPRGGGSAMPTKLDRPAASNSAARAAAMPPGTGPVPAPRPST